MGMRLRILSVIISLWFFQPLFAQKENNFWIFGNKTGLDFNAGSPVAVSSQSGYCWASGPAISQCIYAGYASVSDRHTGELLFYSDGKFVYDRMHLAMPNSEWGTGSSGYTRKGLYGVAGHDGGDVQVGVTQGSLIVPVIGDSLRYYLFSLGPEKGKGSLYYSIVDMSLRGGLGDVHPTRRNILLDTGLLSESMIAVPGNNCDVWVIVHAAGQPVFKAYRITSSGINPRPVVSTAGSALSGAATFISTGGIVRTQESYRESFMDVSPDRQLLAITSRCFENNPLFSIVTGTTNTPVGTALCRFDPNTGQVSDGILLEPWKQCFSTAFSPDSRKLYITGDSGLFVQYDVSTFNAQAVAATRSFVTASPVYAHKGMRRQGDKIYAIGDSTLYPGYRDSIYFINTISVIDRPNLPGQQARYIRNIAMLSPDAWTRGYFSSRVVYYQPKDTIFSVRMDTTICTVTPGEMEGLSMTLTALRGFAAYRWDDGSMDAVRTVTKPGVYRVVSSDYCQPRVDTFIIRHGFMPVFSLGSDTVLCNGESYLLEAPVAHAAYRWQDGSTGSSYRADSSGVLSLEISRDGCRYSDTVSVVIARIGQDLGPDMHFCKGEEMNLTLHARLQEGVVVLWSTGAATPSVDIREAGTYWVQVSYPPCVGTDTVDITEEVCECPFEMPTAFTPNGDGKNDVFRPVMDPACPVSGFVLRIYDRWGERICTVTDPRQGWDGRVKGNAADIGTYMYTLEFEGGTKGKAYYHQGDVTLIR